MILQPESQPARDPELVYEEKRRRLTLSRVRLGALLAALLLPFGVLLELYTEVRDPGNLLTIRAVAIAGCVVFHGLARLPSMERWAHSLSYGLAAWLALGAQLMLIFGAGLTSHYYAGHCVILIAVGLLFPWNIRQISAFSLFFLGVYLAPGLFTTEPLALPMLMSNAYFIANCGIVAVVAVAASQRMRRREFLGRMAIEDQARKLDRASHQLEANLSSLQELEQAKTRFYAKVNHEFRTPLALIAAPLEELTADDSFGLSPEVRKRLELMGRNTERLRTLVDQVIEVARIGQQEEAARQVPIVLEELAQEVASEFEHYAAGRDVRVLVEGATEAPLSSVSAALETILRNLISNAIKFMPGGGVVRVTIDDAREACALTVTDRGIGIPEEHRERIFELFERVEDPEGPQIPGSGVGLAIVRELVRQLHGHLEVAPRPGGGSAFRLTLPRIQLAATGTEIQDREEAPGPRPDGLQARVS